MSYDLIQMLAEPGNRQLFLLGSSLTLGTAKAIYDFYLGGRIVKKGMQKEIPRILKRERRVDEALQILPGMIGLEEAVRNNCPITDSYVVEVASDIGISVVGYSLGKKLATLAYIAIDKLKHGFVVDRYSKGVL
jgi:hypothetical protein